MSQTAGLTIPGPLVRYRELEAIRGLVCVTTTRQPPANDPVGPPYNMGVVGGPHAEHGANRRARLCETLGLDFAGLTLAEQVHGAKVAIVDGGHRGAGRASRAEAIAGVDGLITDRIDTPLMSLSADCCPVVIVDSHRRVIAALHAGRKSTAGGIAQVAVSVMTGQLGCRAGHLRAVVGLSIGPCCYQVGPETIAEFAVGDRHWFEQRHDGLYLDLWRANSEQLIESGVPRDQVVISGLCTACQSGALMSYRRQGPGCGLMATVVGWRD